MTLPQVFEGLGAERFNELVGGISIGSLRTFKLYENVKVRARLLKLNRERLRKAAPKLWQRITEGDEDLARDIAQGMLVSHLDLVVDTLDFLKIPHDGNGFFDKDETAAEALTEGWRQRVFDEFCERYPVAMILLYINHLDWELGEIEEVFLT